METGWQIQALEKLRQIFSWDSYSSESVPGSGMSQGGSMFSTLADLQIPDRQEVKGKLTSSDCHLNVEDLPPNTPRAHLQRLRVNACLSFALCA